MKKKPTPQAPPVWTPAPVSKSLLGCGILILIAQVAMIFSSRNNDKETEKRLAGQFSSLQSEIGRLNSDVGKLKSDVGDFKTRLIGLQSGIAKHADGLEQLQKTLVERTDRNARMRPRVIQPGSTDGAADSSNKQAPLPAGAPPLESIPLPGNLKTPSP